MEPFGIGLIGCGNVGSGVAKLLLDYPQRMAGRAGRQLELRRIVVRDPAKPRDVAIPTGLFTTDLGQVLNDTQIQAVVEVVGGTDYAKRAVLEALAHGKHVVTANKALLARHGAEVFDAGRRFNRAVAFEASVGGGIPIIAALAQGLAANQIHSIQGILNGTSNFILTGMSEAGKTYTEVLGEAQRRGYAEADPSFDVDGVDAAHKLAILAQIAFGVAVPVDSIPCRGIANIQDADIRYAKELGYTIKLLAEAWHHEHQLALHVSPVLLRHLSPLALVRDAYNAILVIGDAVGDTLYYGRGAGQMPTASAVVADIIDLAVGRAQRTFQTLRLWSGNDRPLSIQPSGTVRSRFYLRLMVEDRPGVLAEVARILAQRQISISSVIQHEALDEQEGASVPLVLMTHTTATVDFGATVAEIDRQEYVTPPSVYYPVAD
jgi:homoserine dehydrogenase